LERCALVEGRGGSVSLADADGTQLRAALEHHGLSLGLAGSHQYGNATLAVSLCQAVTAGDEDSKPNTDVDVDVDVDTNVDNNVRIAVDSPTTLRALADAAWPGRCQRLLWSRPTGSGGSGTGTSASDTCKGNRAIEFFLDGAHTPQSLEATVEWFRSKTSTSTSTNTSTGTSTGTTGGNADRRPLPILVFNCSHERNPVELLELLLLLRARDDSDAMGQRASSAPSSAPASAPASARCCCYSRVYFARADSSRPSPLAKASAEELLEERGIRIRPELLLLLGDANGDANAAATVRTWQETLAGVWRHLTEDDECASGSAAESAAESHSKSSSSNAIVCNRTAREVLDDLLSATPESGGDDSSPTTQVFVTGSLYLVGSFLAAMDWKEESSPAPS